MLDIDMEFKKGVLFVRLKGTLCKNSSSCINDLKELIINNGLKYVSLNIKDITYIDDYGLNIIRENYELVKKNSGKFIICGIKKLFSNTCRITKYLYQINDEELVYQLIR